MTWISTKEKLPRCWEKGAWDGLRSDLVLIKDEFGSIKLGCLYEGTLEGNKFQDWADDKDWIIDDKIIMWCQIPD